MSTELRVLIGKQVSLVVDLSECEGSVFKGVEIWEKDFNKAVTEGTPKEVRLLLLQGYDNLDAPTFSEMNNKYLEIARSKGSEGIVAELERLIL